MSIETERAMKKNTLKRAAGSKATSANVRDRLKSVRAAKNCPVLGSCTDNTSNCPKLRHCTINAGTCPKLKRILA
jgi:hypothetical protein